MSILDPKQFTLDERKQMLQAQIEEEEVNRKEQMEQGRHNSYK